MTFGIMNQVRCSFTCLDLIALKASVSYFSLQGQIHLSAINVGGGGGGGGVTQSVERETPGEEVLRSIPAVAARSIPVGSVSV